MRIFSAVLAKLSSVDPNLLILLGCLALVVLLVWLICFSWKFWLTHRQRMFALEHFAEVKADGLEARKPRAQ
jgi:maltodextrin utilization protein YvdJ